MTLELPQPDDSGVYSVDDWVVPLTFEVEVDETTTAATGGGQVLPDSSVGVSNGKSGNIKKFSAVGELEWGIEVDEQYRAAIYTDVVYESMKCESAAG
jgi:hypothetical protein